MQVRIVWDEIMRYKFLLVTGLLFAKCSPEKEAHLFFNQGRVIIDSTAQGQEFLPFDQDDNGAYYPVYYIGKQTDTLILGSQPVSMFSNQEQDSRYDSARNWNSTQDLKVDLFVDTTMNVGHDIIYYHFKEDSGEKITDSVKSIKAFPVFITNMSDSLVMMGTHNFVGYLTREVKDKDGNWVEVEHRLTDLCGTAKRNLVLEPGDIMLAKLLRYKGDTRVSSRLKLSMKFGKIEAYRTYSNVYEDYFDLDN